MSQIEHKKLIQEYKLWKSDHESFKLIMLKSEELHNKITKGTLS